MSWRLLENLKIDRPVHVNASDLTFLLEKLLFSRGTTEISKGPVPEPTAFQYLDFGLNNS
ncbi:hypothetical protein GOODEAATRI_015547, partial [Goodea atripinnis]